MEDEIYDELEYKENKELNDGNQQFEDEDIYGDVCNFDFGTEIEKVTLK